MNIKKHKTQFLWALLISAFFANNSVFAQSFTAYGDANHLSGERYKLTDNVANQKGAVWHNSLVDISKPFTVIFDAYFGSPPTGSKCPNSGQGIAFVLKQNSSETLGNKGGHLGYAGGGGITTSLAIEFDTYNNDALGDISSDHVSIVIDADQANPEKQEAVTNLEDSQPHRIVINWDGISEFTVMIDGIQELQHSVSNNSLSGNVYMGFTGSTGGNSNYQWVELITCSWEEYSYKQENEPLPGNINDIDKGNAGLMTSDCNILVAGRDNSGRPIINKFEPGTANNYIWQNEYEVTNLDEGAWLDIEEGPNYYVACGWVHTSVNNNNTKQWVVAGLDKSDGSVAWDHIVNFSNSSDDIAWDLELAPGNLVAVVGTGDNNVAFIEIEESTGTVNTVMTWGDNQYGGVPAVAYDIELTTGIFNTLSSSGYIIAGTLDPSSNGLGFIIEMDQGLVISGYHAYPFGIRDVVVDDVNGVIGFTGRYFNSVNVNYEACLGEIDDMGDVPWFKSFTVQGKDDAFGQSIIKFPFDEYLVCGYAEDPNRDAIYLTANSGGPIGLVHSINYGDHDWFMDVRNDKHNSEMILLTGATDFDAGNVEIQQYVQHYTSLICREDEILINPVNRTPAKQPASFIGTLNNASATTSLWENLNGYNLKHCSSSTSYSKTQQSGGSSANPKGVNLDLYPTLTHSGEELTIAWKEDLTSPVQIDVYSMSGALLMSSTKEVVEGQDIRFTIGELDSGTFMVHVTYGKESFTEKVQILD